YYGFCSDLSVSGGHLVLDDCSSADLLVIPGDPSPAQDLAISLNNSMISPSATAHNLGVTLDNQLSFSSHVTNVTRSCRFLLYNIKRIRPFLSTQATQVLVQSLVISRLDYCNSLLSGLPLSAICPLQMIQNAAAPLVFNLPKFSHTTPLLRSLHWLPVAARIRFKTLMLAYKAKNGPVPSYLKALVTPRTAPLSLRSTSTARLVPPSLREKAILVNFYRCAIESILTNCITVWYGNCSVAAHKALQREFKIAQRIIGTPLPAVEDIQKKRCLCRAHSILKDSSHPAHSLFKLLPSGRRFRSLRPKPAD
ncbi:hypothetical protein QTP70_029515, partial [Hemibagrus guttatus]